MRFEQLKQPALVISALMMPANVLAQDDTISIQCTGVNESSVGNCVPGSNGQAQCWSTPTSSDATVSVLIEKGAGRVQIPSSLFSLKGGGWVQIEKLEVSEQLIEGRLTLSSFTKPRLKIDRFAGTIDIRSSSYLGASFIFSGNCVKANLSQQRF